MRAASAKPVHSIKPAKLPAVRAAHGPQPLSTRGASLGIRAMELAEAIRHVEHGIPYDALETLTEYSGLTLQELTSLLRIPARTLARRKIAGKFDLPESERLLTVATVFEKAKNLFNGNSVETVEWLRRPRKALGDETPLSYLRTSVGAREVENLIGRLEHGVYS